MRYAECHARNSVFEAGAKATDKVGTGSNDLRQPAEGLYLGSEDWVIERLVWVGNV